MIPVLETERLRLRGHTVADFDPVAAMWADPDVTRHIGGKPSTREESWARMMRYPGHWALMGYGFWLIEEKASGRLVGEAGFADFKREIEPRFENPEHGWALAAWAHGKGFASEALTAQLAWAQDHFGRAPLVCMIDPDNAPSIKLAEKHGYTEFARSAYKGAPTILFRRMPR
ncbi:MAG: GNAT family N-acetyltransferase [Proteobacteria bacterium]|nr:GNAT family N-acetyltransferase [Pseudomonadota bacterium]